MIPAADASAAGPLVTDAGVDLRPDPSRVIARLFVAGREDVGPGDSRATQVIERVLELDEHEVQRAIRDVESRFDHRHRDLHALLTAHAGLVISRIDPAMDLSDDRILLLGASFTHEYSIEGAALCNPSAVLHPEQGIDGDTSFVLSVRGIGEGHCSSIGFRTGRITALGAIVIDPPGQLPHVGRVGAGHHSKAVFHAHLAELSDDSENAAFVLDPLPSQFSGDDLDERISCLEADGATRRQAPTTVANLRSLAASSYSVDFDPWTNLSERVLWPSSPAEHRGMEDARFVRFTADDGEVTYYATYTAFDGTVVAQHLLETTDFRSFAVSPMAGTAAVGKGLALFPRLVGGRYVALSRSDRESNSIAFSDDVRCWSDPVPIQLPSRSWELVQLGNCGSPIETDAGWLVLTHGVGPMRTYSLGAILLDLEDPSLLVASYEQPILSPGNDHRRDGYVPNVVYSCGGFAHGDTLVLPYGIGDQRIGMGTLSIKQLLGRMTPTA